MTLNRIKRQLATGVLMLLLGGVALAEDMDLAGLQLFGPAEVDRYGGGTMPNEGYFFAFDELYWSISRPDPVQVGLPSDPTLPFDTSDVDTSWMGSPFVNGQRVELGRIVNHHGWMVGTHRLETQLQSTQYENVEYNENGVRDFFNFFRVDNRAVTWGVEALGLYRSGELHNGGFIEFMYGARYLELNEDFSALTDRSIIVDPNGTGFWTARAENHIVGPEIGMRYFKKYSRWMTNVEARFMAGYNVQNAKSNVLIGRDLLLVDNQRHYVDARYWNEFTPLVELRVEGRYQVTRSISLRAGWNGMWMNNMARAANLISYNIPPGLTGGGNRQDVFMHGISIGVDINR